jgi:hypothetical protein
VLDRRVGHDDIGVERDALDQRVAQPATNEKGPLAGEVPASDVKRIDARR